MVMSEKIDDEWKSIMRGLDKSRGRMILASAMLISPYQPWLTFNLLMIFTLFSSMTFFIYVGAVSMYYARDNLMTFVEIAHAYTFMLAVTILVSKHYMSNLGNLQDLLKLIDSGIFEYKTKFGEDDDTKLRKTMKFYHRIFQKGFETAIWLCFVLLAVFTPLVLTFFRGGSKKGVEEITYNLAVPLWMPFDMDSKLGYSFGYTLAFINIGLIGFILTSVIPFLVFVALEIYTQYKILERSIISIEHRSLEKYIRYRRVTEPQIEVLRDDPLFVRYLQDSLRENILHHIEILRLFKLYQEVTSTFLGVVIGVSMMILASLSLVLSKMNLLSFEALKFIALFMVELVFVFGYCFLGTFVTISSQAIPTALYNCPWFSLNASQKRTMRIFQFNSSIHIVELKGSGLFLINLQLFVQIVRTTYSIFNIFMSMDS